MRKIGGLDSGFVGSNFVKVSSDGRFLAMLSLPGEKGSDCLIFERATHRSWRVPGAFRLEPLAFERTGNALWIWGLKRGETLPGLEKLPDDTSFIALYDVGQKRFLRSFANRNANDDWSVPSQSALSRDGKTLVVAWQNGWVRAFDTHSGRQKWKMRARDNGDAPSFIVLNSDGTKLLRSFDNEDDSQTTEIVATRSGRVLATLRPPVKNGKRIAFSGGRFVPRGNTVAMLQSDEPQWVFFNSTTGAMRWKMDGFSRGTESGNEWQWSPDARFVVVSLFKSFQVRDARSGRVLDSVSNPKSVWGFAPEAMAFSPDSSLLYALADNYTGLGWSSAVWQLRLRGTKAQFQADASQRAKQRAQEARFALSKPQINSSLILAARCGDDSRVAFLLDKGANIEARNARRETALMEALNANDVYNGPHRYRETVRLLLKRGAQIERDGGALLASAAAKGDDETLRLLLQRGVAADADATVYGTSNALVAAIDFGRVSSVRILLEHGASPNAALPNDASPNDASPKSSSSQESTGKQVAPLWALANANFADKNEVAIARLLLQHGAQINARAAKRSAWRYSETALSSASWLRKTALVKFLLENGADPNIPDTSGQTPLMHIADWDATSSPTSDAPDEDYGKQQLKLELEIVRALLAHGAKPDIRDKDGKTAYDLAVSPQLKAALQIKNAQPK